MKKIFLTLIAVAGLMSAQSSAQVNVSINIGSQPQWAPVGYDYVEYYYLPEIESYYYVPTRQFIYLDNGRWNFSLSLPYRYRGYDLYSGYKVVINSRNAYNNFDNDRIRYARYRGVRTQQVIRYSHDPRYYSVNGRSQRGQDYRGHWDRNEHENRYEDHDNRGWGRGNMNRGNDHGYDRGGDHGNSRGNEHGDNGGHGGRGRH
nr:hypothetical protein [uncultured Pedobacter sp.]